jgi:NitT/TauT family transport system substrate-binding protein
MTQTNLRAGPTISRRMATGGLLSLALPLPLGLLGGCRASAQGVANAPMIDGRPLVHAGAKMAVEMGPIHITLQRLYGTASPVHNGGVINLVGDDRPANIASNGETQNLRYSVEEPRMRILMTIAEGHYPVIGRRSAGITELADLKGKRVLSYERTTAGYFLHKMLQTVGLTLADVTLVETPLGKIGEVVGNREVDAIAIWEPDSEEALRVLRDMGEDVTIFDGQGIYHERYNLVSTADQLEDPAKREAIVRYTRAVIDAVRDINADPAIAAQAQRMVAESGGLYTAQEIALGWPNVKFVANIDEGMLDLFEEEDVWLAALEGRQPRTRSQLAQLIDRSPYDEAMALAG